MMNRDELSDETLDNAFGHAQTLLRPGRNNGLRPLPERDVDVILALCTEVIRRTRQADTVRGMLRCALALATGCAVATGQVIVAGRPVPALHATSVKRWALARGELLCDQIDETTARAEAAGV
jgi:hypothetical protein